MIDALPPVNHEAAAASVAAASAADERADALSYLITAAVRRRLAHRMAHAQTVTVAGPWQHSAGDVLAYFCPDLVAKYRASAAAELAAARAEQREPDEDVLNRLVALASMEPDTADDLEQRGPEPERLGDVGDSDRLLDVVHVTPAGLAALAGLLGADVRQMALMMPP